MWGFRVNPKARSVACDCWLPGANLNASKTKAAWILPTFTWKGQVWLSLLYGGLTCMRIQLAGREEALGNHPHKCPSHRQDTTQGRQLSPRWACSDWITLVHKWHHLHFKEWEEAFRCSHSSSTWYRRTSLEKNWTILGKGLYPFCQCLPEWYFTSGFS